MQKKKEEMPGFKLLVSITLSAVKAPNKYAPPSPINIFAEGKLNNKNTKRIITWAVIKIDKSWNPLSALINNKVEFIIINCKARSPLNPSIKFAPFIINKKHKTTKKIKIKFILNSLFRKIFYT